MEGWFYRTASSPRSWIMGKELAAGGDPFLSFGLSLDGANGDTVQLAVTTGASGSYRGVAAPSVMPLRTWVHLAAVLDGTTLKLLVNGTVVATGTTAGAPVVNNSVPFALGQAFFANGAESYARFPGYARQVRFWSLARTPTQIAAALSESLPTDRVGLVAAWPLDESASQAPRDISGAGRALTSGKVSVMTAHTAVLNAGPYFVETKTAVNAETMDSADTATLIDFNSDGKPDLVVGQQVLPPVYPAVYKRLRAFQNSNGAFSDVTDAVLGTVSMVHPFRFNVADFNGDGRLDLLAGGSGPDTPPADGEQSRLFLQSSDGKLPETTLQFPVRMAFNHGTAVGDIDGDGDQDIFMCDIGPWPYRPRFYLNDGHGNYVADSTRLPSDLLGPIYTACVFVDVNGDGYVDLVLGANYDSQNELLLNDGTGHFQHSAPRSLPPKMHDATAVTVQIAAADLNGDGCPDLVMTTGGGWDIYSAPGTSVDGTIAYGSVIPGLQILINDGNGRFIDQSVDSGISFPATARPLARLQIADFNQDGKPDLFVLLTSSVMRQRLFLNVGTTGRARFVDASEILAGQFPTTATQIARFHQAGDLDGDGLMDDAIGYVSDPYGSFTGVASARALKVADLNLFTAPVEIVSPPASQVAGRGASIALSVKTNGFPAPTYQWRKNGVVIAGATSPSLPITNAQPADSGDYSVVATNPQGSVTSAAAAVTVKAPPAQDYVGFAGQSPLKAPAIAAFAPGATFTLEAWVRLAAATTGPSFLMGKVYSTNADPYNAFNLQLGAGNHVVVALADGPSAHQLFLTSTGTIQVGAWTHVAMTFNAGAVALYLNGQLDSSSVFAGSAPVYEPSVPFSLGLGYRADGSTANNPFPGLARQARFWNVARSPAQISAAMVESLPSDSTGLVAAWPLDEATGTTARDISGHGFSLTTASGSIASTRIAIADAQPFFASTVTNIADGSLQYVNPGGTLIDVDKDGKLEVIEVQGGPATFPVETRTRIRAYRLQNGAYVDATDAILGTVTMVAPARSLVADFNGDGWNDLLIVGIGTDAPPYPGEQSQLLLNDQHGRLVNVTVSNLPLRSGAYTHDATYGDIDGDGDLDLYMGNNTLNATPTGPRIYLNDGTGKFSEANGRLPAEIENLTVTYTGCELLDVNGDGKADLVLGGWPGGSGSNNEILLNNGSGTFARTGAPAMPPKLFGTAGTVVRIIPADLNGDGRVDLVLSTTDHYQHAALQIVLRQADGTFVDATAQSGLTWDPSVAEIDRSTTVIDVNGDGKPDIVAHYYDTTNNAFHTRLFLNRGDATFIEASAILPLGPIGTVFHTGDVDGDGTVDFVSVSAPWINFLRGLKPISLSYFYDAPVIASQPVPRTVTAGSSVTFTVAASGFPMPTCQWQKDGVNILGATNSTYTIPHAGLGDAGSYRVFVINAVGGLYSSGAWLEVKRAGLMDFSADGKADLFWSNTTTGERSVWFMNGSAYSGGLSLGLVSVAWTISAVNDFNGDGQADIFLSNTSTGDRAVWVMNGTTIATNAFLGTIPTDWVVSATGDFNGDGKADVFWTDTATGNRAVWLMNGGAYIGGGFTGTVPVAWVISGTGDFNADGKADIVWSNTTTGERSVWFMDGYAYTGGTSLGVVPVAWTISAVNDFNGDGKADIFLSNTSTGDRAVWVMNGTTIATNAFLGTIPTNWVVSTTGDFNGDGKADVFWTDTATGNRAVWLMNGGAYIGGGFAGTVPVEWVAK